MKLIKQNRKQPGCGPACVAILAGRSYAEAKTRFCAGDKERTEWPELRQALHSFDKQTTKPRWAGRLSVSHRQKNTVEGELACRLNYDAILKVNETADENWHWVAWDKNRSKILDPMDSDVPRERRRYKIHSVMEVLP